MITMNAWQRFAAGVALCVLLLLHTDGQTASSRANGLTALPVTQPALGPILMEDDFREGLGQWRVELERGGNVRAADGTLEIDVPAGATLWFEHELRSPVAIVYDATAVSAGGPNDRVSDLNCFWMARNRDGSPPYERRRTGRFAEYNDLLTYYVGLGGNSNTTTRFRRYVGDPEIRPMLPEHDLSAPDTLLVPNRRQTITLVVNGPTIEYWRDDRRLFHYGDDAPYTSGWFALRTTQSHLRIERFGVHALLEASTP